MIDYGSYTNNIIDSEIKLNEDVNLDGAIGFNKSILTQKNTDTSGDLLFADAENNTYIETTGGDLISVVDSYNGSSIKFDHYSSWADGSILKMLFK